MTYNADTMSFEVPDTDMVYVSGLPTDVTISEVAEHFGSIGVVKFDKKKDQKKVLPCVLAPDCYSHSKARPQDLNMAKLVAVIADADARHGTMSKPPCLHRSGCTRTRLLGS